MEQRVSVSIADGVADVRRVRADKMNALDAAMFEALVATRTAAGEKGSGRGVIRGGAGVRAGRDMGRFAALKKPE